MNKNQAILFQVINFILITYWVYWISQPDFKMTFSSAIGITTSVYMLGDYIAFLISWRLSKDN